MIWVQKGTTALELARFGGERACGNAESAYPAVIELLTNPSAVLVSVWVQKGNGEEWDRRSEILQKTLRRCVCSTLEINWSKHVHFN